VNWIAVEESGGMTRWINLDNVTEVRSVSEAQITVRSAHTGHGLRFFSLYSPECVELEFSEVRAAPLLC
jgi:hypothetical protein